MYVYVSKEFLSLNDMEVLFLVQGAWCMVHGSFGCRTFFARAWLVYNRRRLID
jgi:hypothetical protein